MHAAPLEGLARTATAYGAVLTLWLLATALLRRPLTPYQQSAAVVLWLGATAVALAHAIGVLREPAGHQVAVTLAYAAVAAVLIPVLWPKGAPATLGAGEGDPAERQPAGGVPVLAAGVTVVLVLRLVAVW